MSLLVWFRRDLRVQDNPALWQAVQDARERAQPLTALYVFDPEGVGGWAPGGASRWYLERSLLSLHETLAGLGVPLKVERGRMTDVVRAFAHKVRIEGVYWNRVIEPGQAALDQSIAQSLRQTGVTVEVFDDDCLLMPEQLRRPNGERYKVFTPFWRRALELLEASPATVRLRPVPAPLDRQLQVDPGMLQSAGIAGRAAWQQKLAHHWMPGEHAALDRWARFFLSGIEDYDHTRDLPGLAATSRLSSALHFGELSAARLFAQCAERLAHETSDAARAGIRRYLAELGWREFGRHVLYGRPDSINRSLDRRFDQPGVWKPDPDGRLLRAWQRGETGIALVDAGMRELWETGWMHNRVRMVVASFLTKNLGIHWREGARWFWDTLVDADLASNTLGWQWVAGCGTDAAPYYRIFNPDTQAERFDPDHLYRSRWLPDGLRPTPIADLKTSRERALSRYRMAVKGEAA